MSRNARDITTLQRSATILSQGKDPRAYRDAVEALTRLRSALGDDVACTIGFAMQASIDNEILAERTAPDRITA